MTHSSEQGTRGESILLRNGEMANFDKEAFRSNGLHGYNKANPGHQFWAGNLTKRFTVGAKYPFNHWVGPGNINQEEHTIVKIERQPAEKGNRFEVTVSVADFGRAGTEKADQPLETSERVYVIEDPNNVLTLNVMSDDTHAALQRLLAEKK